MAAYAQQQLNALVSNMYREGFLDEQFQQIRALDEGGSPDFLVEVMGLFCTDAERILNELSSLLNQPDVDYKKVDAYVHQLKGSSASVGAQSVKLACMLVRESCDKSDREGCLQALNLAKQRFYELSKRLKIMIQFHHYGIQRAVGEDLGILELKTVQGINSAGLAERLMDSKIELCS